MKSILPSIWYQFLAVVWFDWWENGFLSFCGKCVCLCTRSDHALNFDCVVIRCECFVNKGEPILASRTNFRSAGILLCATSRLETPIPYSVKSEKCEKKNEFSWWTTRNWWKWINWQYSLRMFKLAWNRIVTETLKKKNPKFYENEDEPSCDASNRDNFYLCNIFSIIFIFDVRWEHSFWTHRTNR